MRAFILVAASVLASCPAARAQTYRAEAGLRTFGGRERLTYAEVAVERGDVFFRAVGARKTRTTLAATTLLHGGSDVELGVAFKPTRRVRPQVGLAYADTGAQRGEAFLTLRARYAPTESAPTTFAIEPRAALGRQSFLGLRLEATRNQRSGDAVWASVTPMLLGKNGVSPSSGASRRVALWELGFRNDRVAVGIANALGNTTGMSLSPSLSGNALFVKTRLGR